MENGLKGSVFMSYRHNKIGIIHKATGCGAMVEMIYPSPKTAAEQHWVMDLNQEMYYLEQIGGCPIGVPLRCRPKQHYDNGTIKPLVDRKGYIKVNVDAFETRKGLRKQVQRRGLYSNQ